MNKRKVIMIYTQFFDLEGKELKIGGIESYLQQLSVISEKLKYQPIIIQYSNREFRKEYNNIIVYGVKSSKHKVKKLVEKAYEIGDIEKDIIIFGSSHMNIKNKFKNSMAIQHGIYWDRSDTKNKERNKLITMILKSLQIFLEVKRNNLVNTTICVDYNYINWYRSLTKITNEQIVVVPNFTVVPYEFEKKKNNMVRIIYARRFEKIRGAELIIEPFKRILKEYKNVEITIAGSGTYEDRLKKEFEGYNVKFDKYNSNESIEFHKNYDIAVVPSIASEGTSLSLLEAMASKCCVIATNIGGMTNIIINNYNGILIPPAEDELYKNLKNLIDNEEVRMKLSKGAWESVYYGFNINNWYDKWGEILKK